MGQVVSLSAFRKKKEPKIRMTVSTEVEEFILFHEGLISQWEFAESKNNLNSFIAEKLQIEEQDFVNDLNIVADLEKETNITFRVESPTYSENTGWVSSFTIGDDIYDSIESDTEPKARLFCVLLYHALMQAASNASRK